MRSIIYEQTLTRFGDCTLTTHRLRRDSKRAGYARVVSIMLEKISSCSLTRTSHPLLLLLSVLCLAAAVAMYQYGRANLLVPVALACAGVLLLVITHMTRDTQLIFTSDGGERVRANVAGSGVDAAKQFIDRVEDAKNSRYFALATASAGQGAAEQMVIEP
jgi:hypothetical protein